MRVKKPKKPEKSARENDILRVKKTKNWQKKAFTPKKKTLSYPVRLRPLDFWSVEVVSAIRAKEMLSYVSINFEPVMKNIDVIDYLTLGRLDTLSSLTSKSRSISETRNKLLKI